MKKSILIILITGFTIASNAGNSRLFNYNAEEVRNELARLQSLEDYIYSNPGMTFSALQIEKTDLTAMNLNCNYISFSGYIDGPLGIPPFIWGCVAGVWGIAIVYFMMEDDKKAIEKSILGCVFSRIAGCAIYVVIYAAIYGLAFSSWYWYY